MSERWLWVDLGAGSLEPQWFYIAVQFKDGRPDFSVEPRWLREDERAETEGLLPSSNQSFSGKLCLALPLAFGTNALSELPTPPIV